MIRGKFNQLKCEKCSSWHFALSVNDEYHLTELKCCRCGTIIDLEKRCLSLAPPYEVLQYDRTE